MPHFAPKLRVIAACPVNSRENVTQTLIGLARLSESRRILLAGSSSNELYGDLYRHGCTHVSTVANCGRPRNQFDALLVAWRRESLEALEKYLGWYLRYLSPHGVLAVWVERDESSVHRRLRSMLDRLGLRIEAGASCPDGLAFAARSVERAQAAKVA
jgi:hypothetical protein